MFPWIGVVPGALLAAGSSPSEGAQRSIDVKALRRHPSERAQAGDDVLHFVLESSRLTRLRTELGSVIRFDVLTDRQASDKFCMVRVELE